MKRHITVTFMVLAAGLAVTGCRAASTAAGPAASGVPAAATTVALPPPDGNNSYVQVTHTLPPAPSAPSAPSALQLWCAGDGYSDYLAVESSLSRLGSDAGSNDIPSVMSDGRTLFTDTEAADRRLPPGTNSQVLDYGLYMGYLMVAGAKAANGDISGASSALKKASQLTSKVNDLVNQCQAG